MTDRYGIRHTQSAFLFWLLTLSVFCPEGYPAGLPKGFDYADRHIPKLMTELKYFSASNFLGRPVEGYHADRAILTSQAIRALAEVQKDLNAFGLGIKLYDAYRPQRSVDHFVRWSRDPHAVETKTAYYPHVDKSELFEQGYIDKRSGHSRGSTVDLTLVDLESGAELDMGSSFDFFNPLSRPDADGLAPAQRAHRLLLSTIMQRRGFKPYPKEWWHFTLANEPFPATYFDFPVE